MLKRSGNSVVVDPNFNWSGEARERAGTFEQAIVKLDYLQDMDVCIYSQ